MPNEHREYSGEGNVPVEAIRTVDPNVVTKLPEGTIVKELVSHGASFWTRTARPTTELNGELKEYFLKTSFGHRGKEMMYDEFTSMSLIYEATPGIVPRPIAWGSYATINDVHFFLCDFHDMTDELPYVNVFPAKLAELHRNGTSPNGKFGFAIPTYYGNTQLVHGWADTWEEYFTTRTKALLACEQEAQGPNGELQKLSIPFFEKVVPRLLRPLETDGRSTKPCLVHGDLWHGNATMDGNTERPIIFNAVCFYAHNEYDLGVWRATWNKIGKSYISRYHWHFPISQPEEDHDDRNRLYAMLISDMRNLAEKFPDGYEGWKREQRDSGSQKRPN